MAGIVQVGLALAWVLAWEVSLLGHVIVVHHICRVHHILHHVLILVDQVNPLHCLLLDVRTFLQQLLLLLHVNQVP